ncbi:MAG TPA: protein tyrosine phosphatase [Leptospiraceae bacterium]|jgi:protein-tyrosine phosphatase|nr:protein tyrosine phosphatase [Spirochaetaceae bacterium]HBS06756.1 protein tyrosine phosphatase [Leptospiraceae bacterium]|tara:strand:- start:489 stop:1004 length:516 start_codon:yes stop_codon:yes gene_type:complete
MHSNSGALSILFVCHGNICRSPAAEGALRHLIRKQGFDSRVKVDSAGTSAYHIGEIPHPDTRKAAAEAGIKLEHRARQFTAFDLERFDYILAMDRHNYEDVLASASSDEERSRIFMYRKFDPEVEGSRIPDVPDPYYGGFAGFREVQSIVHRTSESILEWLRSLEPAVQRN